MIMSILIGILTFVLIVRWIASSYEDRKFYNRIQRRQELIRRYTSED